VNIPLAYLKGHSDDLLLRSVVKTFLFKIIKIPHIVSSPDARGGLVINFHIDSNAEHSALPWFMDHGYITSTLKYSVHITAGPDCYNPGDQMGFWADSVKGTEIIRRVMRYGIIGSHGGWAHNWFSDNIQNGTLGDKEMEKYIKMNNEALEKVTGYKIKEYSAPNGVFPQPASVRVLASLDIKSYYYPGDSGSSPNRTFYGGKKLSDDIIAFPVMTFGKKASLQEFIEAKVSGREMEGILTDLVDYTIRNRTVRLYYTHPYDIYRGPDSYKKAFRTFIDDCTDKQAQGKLQVETMSYFRDFLMRLIAVKKSFIWENGSIRIDLSSTKSLKNMVVAIPRNYLGKEAKIEKTVEEDSEYYYVPTDTNATHLTMDISYE
jgi:hypothetical protein